MLTGFLTFTIVGPAMKTVSDWVTNGIVWLYDTTSFIGMGIFGLTLLSYRIDWVTPKFPLRSRPNLSQPSVTVKARVTLFRCSFDG